MPLPRLLFLCQNLPFPPDGGAQVRSWNVLRLLAERFDATALCFYRRAARATPREVRESLAEMREVCRAEAFPIGQEHSRVRRIADHLPALALGRAYTRAVYASSPFRGRLRTLLRTERFDLAHVDSLDLSGYLPELEGIPTVCGHHNVESALLRRRASAETSARRRAWMHWQARAMEAEERRWCPRVALNVAVSRADREQFRRIAPGARFIVAPNGVDTRAFRPGPPAADGIVFVGPHGWGPNRDGMEWFCRRVLPAVHARRPDVPVTWVGRAPEAAVREFARQGVRMTGHVDDVRPYLRGAACFVAPLLVGGGTRLKILEAWAMGMPVVSTAAGCEGLDARDGENLLVRDGPEAFAAVVLRVLEDAGLRARLGAEGRRTAEREYDWRVIGALMLRAYEELLAPERPLRVPVPAG